MESKDPHAALSCIADSRLSPTYVSSLVEIPCVVSGAIGVARILRLRAQDDKEKKGGIRFAMQRLRSR